MSFKVLGVSKLKRMQHMLVLVYTCQTATSKEITCHGSNDPQAIHFIRQRETIQFLFLCLLTLNAPIATKVVCFSRLLKCLRSLYGKQCGPNQTAPIGAVCSGSTLFASILNSSVMQGNYLRQTTSAGDIFRCIFFLAL